MGRAASLADVAGHAGADDVLPTRDAAPAAGHHVIEREFARREVLSAVLAQVAVAGEDVTAVKPQTLAGTAVARNQPDDPGRLEFVSHSADPILIGAAEVGLQGGELTPRIEVVGSKLPLLDVDHLGQLTEEQRDGPTDVRDVNRYK